MTDQKLTENFKLSEFTKNDVNDYQLYLLRLLANQLQKIRDHLQVFALPKKKVSITITSGVRTQADYDRLIAKGYHPSKTSDHFCGLQIYSTPTIGAADIKVSNCKLSTKEIATAIISLADTEIINVGQVIYEKNPATGAEWIHIGNDPAKVFISDVPISRTKYLMSLDNGKTYVDFKK